jgi:hypothetical protein
MMRTRFTADPGVSLPGIGLQTGMTRGIEIDNTSGSWLYIPSLETFVPPYTIGWAMTFPIAVSSLDINAGNGPAGQLGTPAGDAITVYLTSYTVERAAGVPAPGTPFIPTTTATPQLPIYNNVGTGSGIVTVITPPAGRRIRIYTLIASYQPPGGAVDDAELSCNWIRLDHLTLLNEIFAPLRVSPANPNAEIIFGGENGIDLPPDDILRVSVSLDWGSGNNIVATTAHVAVI